MSVHTPFSRISPDQLRRIKENAAGALVTILAQEAVSTPDNTVIRDLVPADFSGTVTDASFTNQVLGIVDVYVNATTADRTVPPNTALAFFGVADRNAIPTLMQVRFGVGAGPSQLMDQVHLEACYVTQEAGVFFDPPAFYRPNQVVNLDLLFLAATAIAAETIVFIGLVAEPRGVTISPAVMPRRSQGPA